MRNGREGRADEEVRMGAVSKKGEEGRTGGGRGERLREELSMNIKRE